MISLTYFYQTKPIYVECSGTKHSIRNDIKFLPYRLKRVCGQKCNVIIISLYIIWVNVCLCVSKPFNIISAHLSFRFFKHKWNIKFSFFGYVFVSCHDVPSRYYYRCAPVYYLILISLNIIIYMNRFLPINWTIWEYICIYFYQV